MNKTHDTISFLRYYTNDENKALPYMQSLNEIYQQITSPFNKVIKKT